MRTGITVASFDTGGTTGAASYALQLKPENRRSDSYNVIESVEFGPHPHHVELWNYLAGLAPDVILYEAFDQVDSEASILVSLEYIGIINLYAALTKTPVHKRIREFKDVSWLKGMALNKLGCYTPGKPHGNDAKRHLIHYIVSDLNRKEILGSLRK